MRLSRPYITDIKSDLVPDASGTRNIGTAAFAFAEGHFDLLYGDGSNLSGVASTDHSTLNNLTWSTAGHTLDTHVLPNASGTINIGSAALAFAEGHFDDLYVGNETLNIGNNTAITSPSGILTFADATTPGRTLADLDAGGAGSARDITQSSHGFSVADLLRWDADNNDYTEAKADTAANAEVIGIVTNVADSDNFTISYSGYITLEGQSFTDGTVYFLSESTAGLLTSTEPTEVNEVVKPVLVAVSATAAYFFNWRGSVNAGGSGSSAGGVLTSIFSAFGGDESQGAISLSGATNVSDIDDANRVGFIQATSFDDAGNTLTVDTGYLIMGVSGTCTISGTIDADAQGGKAGEHGTSSGSHGYTGMPFMEERGAGMSTTIQLAGSPTWYQIDGVEGYRGQDRNPMSVGGAGGGGGCQSGIPDSGGCAGGAGGFGGDGQSGNGGDGEATPALKLLLLTGGDGDNAVLCNSSMLPILLQSGGGGGGGGAGGGGAGPQAGGEGGTGGGVIYIECDNLVFSGTITADGTNGEGTGGETGSGGAGGGGCVIVRANTITTNSGTITVTGGTGGATGRTGGNGAAGFKNVVEL